MKHNEHRMKDGEGMDAYPPLENLCLKGNKMELFKSGFDKFWDAWPSNPRKGAKSACKTKWEKTYCETQADQIVKHVTWMKTTEQWLKSNGAFIPAPLVYLNQQRWDGAEVPELAPKTEVDPALLKIETDRQRAVAMPEDVRKRLAELRKQVV